MKTKMINVVLDPADNKVEEENLSKGGNVDEGDESNVPATSSSVKIVIKSS